MQIQMQMQMKKQQIKVIQKHLYKKCALQKVSSKSCETIPLINKTFKCLCKEKVGLVNSLRCDRNRGKFEEDCTSNCTEILVFC